MTSIARIILLLIVVLAPPRSAGRRWNFLTVHPPRYRSFPLPTSKGMFRNFEERLLTQRLNPKE
jgi:hypothetical protein